MIMLIFSTQNQIMNNKFIKNDKINSKSCTNSTKLIANNEYLDKNLQNLALQNKICFGSRKKKQPEIAIDDPSYLQKGLEIQRLQAEKSLAKEQRNKIPCVLQAIFVAPDYKPLLKDISELKEKIKSHELIINSEEFTKEINKDCTEDMTKQENLLIKQAINPTEHNADSLFGVSYSKLLDAAFEPFKGNKDMSLAQKASIIRTIKLLNADGDILKKEILPGYKNLINYAKERKNYFIEAVQKKWTDDDIDNYFDKNKYDIINALILIKEDSLKAKINQKFYKFDKTIKNSAEIMKNDDLLTAVHNTSKTIKHSSDKMGLIDLVKGLSSLKCDNSKIIDTLEETVKLKKPDLSLINKLYLENFLSNAGMDKSKVNKIDESQYKKFNLDYTYTIPLAIEKLNELKMPEHIDKFKKIITSIFNDNYNEYLNDTSTIHGRANAATKELFKENGLNYDTWLNYSQERVITLKTKDECLKDSNLASNKIQNYISFPEKTETLKIKTWSRNPGHDLFQGNYSGVCIALDGIHCFNAIDSLLHTSVQMFEIKKENKPVGTGYMFWAKNQYEQDPFFVVDSLVFPKDYKKNPQLKVEIMEFMKDYAKAVSNKDTKVVIGNQFINFNDYDNTHTFSEPKRIEARIIGNTGTEKNYLDTLVVDSLKDRHTRLDGKNPHLLEIRELITSNPNNM